MWGRVARMDVECGRNVSILNVWLVSWDDIQHVTSFFCKKCLMYHLCFALQMKLHYFIDT